MKKFLVAILLFLLMIPSLASSQSKKSALELEKECFKQETVHDSIEYLKTNINLCATDADKRSTYFLLGRLQEQLELYSDAQISYAKAAGIKAADAQGVFKVTAEKLVLNAVRCALCSNDWETALSYLSSNVRLSKNPEIIAYINLYTAWAQLCRAADTNETKDTIELLKAYSSMESMKYVRSKILFTLWYLTSDASYKNQLLKDYPLSPESSIAKENSQIMSVPFWYLVPRSNSTNSLAKTEEISIQPKTKAAAKEKNQPKVEQKPSQTKQKVRQQLGLYRQEKYAKEMAEKAAKAGFKAYIFDETRSSGTKYYIVAVDENSEGTIGKKLKAAGFDCYPIN